jgi:hypothetical protein
MSLAPTGYYALYNHALLKKFTPFPAKMLQYTNEAFKRCISSIVKDAKPFKSDATGDYYVIFPGDAPDYYEMEDIMSAECILQLLASLFFLLEDKGFRNVYGMNKQTSKIQTKEDHAEYDSYWYPGSMKALTFMPVKIITINNDYSYEQYFLACPFKDAVALAFCVPRTAEPSLAFLQEENISYV